MHITISLASDVTNELVTGWCITEWVKRLVGNEIVLAMRILTIESRESSIPTDKGNYVCCHKGSTDKDLRRICRNQYGHPGSAISYWPERHLGHVYVILEPIGSARFMFVDDIVLYMSYVCWWPNIVRSPGWDHGHDEEIHSGLEVNINI